MNNTVQYLYDPLCGWCYGATAAIASLLEQPDIRVELLPTGLFSGDGARPMDDEFAAFAWSNDQRIQQLTAQPFSDHYRQLVLGDRQQRFDSGPATLALTAVSLSAPDKELQTLKAIQHARYVEGLDVTSLTTLAGLLQALDLEQAAATFVQLDAALLTANQNRIRQARQLMRQLNAGGVPTLIATTGTRQQLLNVSAAYSNPQALITQLQSA